MLRRRPAVQSMRRAGAPLPLLSECCECTVLRYCLHEQWAVYGVACGCEHVSMGRYDLSVGRGRSVWPVGGWVGEWGPLLGQGRRGGWAAPPVGASRRKNGGYGEAKECAQGRFKSRSRRGPRATHGARAGASGAHSPGRRGCAAGAGAGALLQCARARPGTLLAAAAAAAAGWRAGCCRGCQHPRADVSSRDPGRASVTC